MPMTANEYQPSWRARPRPSWRTYAQLVRLPNLFTAFADILLGALATGSVRERRDQIALLLIASGCLYCGGMVWNDFFDIEQDRRERPDRPLPSGRISRVAAGWLGVGLLLAGCCFAAAVSWIRQDPLVSAPFLL